MIETTQQLADYLSSLKGNFRAMDLEADSLFHYHEKISLLQFTDGENHQLIDPLAIEDMQPIKNFLKDAELWMHGADYDIVMMRRDLGVVPPIIWDTQIAARLLGVKKFGYGGLVEHFLGIEISKTSQKADWSKRPLTPIMAEYAINDVRYLKPIVDLLLEQLHEKGRYQWFVESCENARQKVLDRPEQKDDPWRISGSGKMKPRELAFLRAIWYWRDHEASEWNRPTFMVCGNKQLLTWSADTAAGKRIQLPKHFRTNRRKRLFAAIDAVNSMDEKSYPQRPERGKKRIKDAAFESRVAAMIKKRDAIADELDIDSSLLINRALLESIAANEIEPADVLMKWQLELLEF